MLEAAGMPDPGMDGGGLTLSLIAIAAVWLYIALRDWRNRD